MMWHEVIPLWVAMLEADGTLIAALGGQRIYPAQAATPVRIPSVEWVVVTDNEEELFNPFIVQVDYWVKGVNRAAVIEARIRTLTHRDVARVMGDYRLWTRYLDSRTHEYTAEEGVTHRSLDFLFEPLRSKYALASEPGS
jgi:hypothetical protein